MSGRVGINRIASLFMSILMVILSPIFFILALLYVFLHPERTAEALVGEPNPGHVSIPENPGRI